ncbi:MAG: peroxiredoxin [Armatimonadota bacterium]|nr:peroxiredoxin [Armatimonadota bacterium]MDR7451156.1 peroxiredoxin [Armatimonadota bacterium]MDR7467239.1 peroxiredoxin [Armatimonadota bacterium]MDR7494833.1 peroxiredoxin [Armatimonadota bacterium]MDR7500274.1 peroxiredoxin [Armatimonadota bacterium]
MPVEVGQKVPDVPLVNAERRIVKLSEFLGRPTVLAFFPGAFTGVCTKEACTFRDSMARFAGVGGQVIGISVDSPFAQKAFADAHNLNFTFLSDFNRHAVKTFGIEDPNFAGGALPGVAKRSVFVLDREGTVRYRWVSDNPGVEPNYDEVAEAVKAMS